jgi:hypothetical protein
MTDPAEEATRAFRVQRGPLRGAGMVLFLACLLCEYGEALEQRATVGAVEVSVYAPDWTWQKRDLNILFVLRDAAAAVSIALVPPVGLEDHFTYGQVAAGGDYPAVEVSVPPGETVREEFTGITSRDGVPLQTYNFGIALRAGDAASVIAYPAKTIRGAVVSPGKWTLYLPVGLALVWSVAFVWALRKMSVPGAWTTPSASLDDDEEGAAS